MKLELEEPKQREEKTEGIRGKKRRKETVYIVWIKKRDCREGFDKITSYCKRHSVHVAYSFF